MEVGDLVKVIDLKQFDYEKYHEKIGMIIRKTQNKKSSHYDYYILIGENPNESTLWVFDREELELV